MDGNGVDKPRINQELLNAVREINRQLEEFPIHTHQKAIEVLIVLGNHRLMCAQQEQEQDRRQAEIALALGAGEPRIITH
jgi:hypothetical protein